MQRMLPRLLCAIAIALCSNAALHGRANKTVIHAATSSMPIVIAVLADNYTDQNEFELDAKNFITNGLMMHPYYKSHAADLQIEAYFDPVDAGSQSDYFFQVGTPRGNCVLSWSDTAPNDTLSAITAVVGNPKHTVVIGNQPFDIGCTEGKWTYVALDAVGSDVLAHELGHGLAALDDEWFFESNRGVSHPGIPDNLTKNCFDPRPPGTTAPWVTAGVPGAGSVQGCDFFELDAVHAFPLEYNGHRYCLMGAQHDSEFCPVCYGLMEDEFNYLRNPDIENPDIGSPAAPTNLRIIKAAVQQPAPGTSKPAPPAPPQPNTIARPVPPRPILQLVVSFNPTNGAISVKKGFPITARYVPSHRRLGEWMYEIVDLSLPLASQTVEVGVFPSNLFRSRSYQGGVAHQTSPVHATDVTIEIPDVASTYSTDKTRQLAIRIYQIGPGVTDRVINRGVFSKLRAAGSIQQRGEGVTAQQIRGVL